jgi:hypothetical protein
MMLGRLARLRDECLANAADARGAAKEAVDPDIKASHAAIERQWLRLAESYNFLQEADRLFDARPVPARIPATDQLDHLISTVVQFAGPQSRAAFFAVSGCGTKLHHITGMSDGYARAVDGFAVGPSSLGCGLAASINEFVLHPDVLTDPRWEPWLDLASVGQFRSCWSFPVTAPSGQVIGTFAMYFDEPRRATVRDLDFAMIVARCGGIIMSANAIAPRQ